MQQPQGKSKCSEEIKPKMVAQVYNPARDEKEYWGYEVDLDTQQDCLTKKKIWPGMVM